MSKWKKVSCPQQGYAPLRAIARENVDENGPRMATIRQFWMWLRHTKRGTWSQEAVKVVPLLSPPLRWRCGRSREVLVTRKGGRSRKSHEVTRGHTKSHEGRSRVTSRRVSRRSNFQITVPLTAVRSLKRDTKIRPSCDYNSIIFFLLEWHFSFYRKQYHNMRVWNSPIGNIQHIPLFFLFGRNSWAWA